MKDKTFGNYGNLTGKTFGYLFVKSFLYSKNGHKYWLCKCSCGKETIKTSNNLVTGRSKSCGCYKVKRLKELHIKPKGWITKCVHCGKEFRTVSNKQIYCSDECSFLDRAKLMPNGCIEWQGCKNTQNYGVLRIHVNGKNKMIGAHRYAWERINGKIPDGLCVCHKCDNPKCVNVEHMFLGSHYDNNHDRSLKGRSGKRVYTIEDRQRYTEMFEGENNGSAKLTKEQVLKIMSLKNIYSHRQLAEMFNISKSVITSIFTGRSWNCVTGIPYHRRKTSCKK